MHSVTSNAVAEATKKVYSYNQNNIEYYKVGKIVFVQILKPVSGANPQMIYTIPEEYRPTKRIRGIVLNNRTDTPCGQSVLEPNGEIKLFSSNGASFSGDDYVTMFCFIQV